ncbi:MAG: DNA recombination protein RmuC [Bacteroidales bacterium]|nr:DNA recombination protein RmuC [Bacteroidales bacterium]
MQTQILILIIVSVLNLVAIVVAAVAVVRRLSRDNSQELTEQFARKLSEEGRNQREEIQHLAEHLRQETALQARAQRDEFSASVTRFQDAFDKNTQRLVDVQKEQFAQMNQRQKELVDTTERKLEEMRNTVDEKLQKTLNERIGQSFRLVSEQLESVQKGLGEMKSLATDVGGLKKVLSNVKVRGTFGELQLQHLLEQMMSPEQYETNVRTAHTGSERVEFAIKLPGKEEGDGFVYLPIDSKFPKDVYEGYVEAQESGDTTTAEEKSKLLETVIKKMAKDIHDKYLDPPYTTDFAIMFLPFENIYAEVIRRTTLMEELQRTHHVMVTGPTTLGALLSSLQMGFRTLAIQKRSSEVWKTLGVVKAQFEKFGGLLDKAQRNLQQATTAIDTLKGTRTNAIIRSLKEVETLPLGDEDAVNILPILDDDDV